MQYKNIFSLFSGVLETPSLPPQLNIETVSYKIILTSKPAVGKTSTVAKLLGQGKMDRLCPKKKINKLTKSSGQLGILTSYRLNGPSHTPNGLGELTYTLVEKRKKTESTDTALSPFTNNLCFLSSYRKRGIFICIPLRNIPKI